MQQCPDVEQGLPQTGEQSLVLGGGCFWCTEAVYLALDGVLSVTSGYAGGSADTANYDAVCSGLTDHAEVIDIRYDAARISLGQLLKVFFCVAHDPTQLDRQGNDRGRQYRSAVFYSSEAQAKVVRDYIEQLNSSGLFGAAIVTTLEPLAAFYPAESYHQNYAARNPMQPYIMFAATPKVAKLQQTFPEKLKPRN
ncbi:MAG: peptide-methionine (S)-S-oxide reductase MsrA [Alcanivoracaceae bacterium]|nr:peptide-methionine (S)-S-oxide reductase MsrA [Alcanivoracaceae bacterium]